MSSHLQHAIKDTKEKSDATLEELKLKVNDISHEAVRIVDDEAHRNPWKLAGFVAIFSVVLGFLLGRITKR